MSAGYERGYYGVSAPAQRRAPVAPPRNSLSPKSGIPFWIKITLGVGVGAGIWFLWPRAQPPEIKLPQFPSDPPPGQPVGPQSPPPVLAGAPVEGASPPQLVQEALGRGFSSQQAYEDAIVSSARQLRETGATVTLAPHLQHLTSRLGPGA